MPVRRRIIIDCDPGQDDADALFLAFASRDQLDILGFHMPFPALGRVERFGDSFRWVQESYRLKV